MSMQGPGGPGGRDPELLDELRPLDLDVRCVGLGGGDGEAVPGQRRHHCIFARGHEAGDVADGPSGAEGLAVPVTARPQTD